MGLGNRGRNDPCPSGSYRETARQPKELNVHDSLSLSNEENEEIENMVFKKVAQKGLLKQ